MIFPSRVVSIARSWSRGKLCSCFTREIDALCPVKPDIVGEVEDVAMLQVLGQHGHGLFAAPSVVAK